MENIRKLLLDRIRGISERYQCHGFWKYGTAYVNGLKSDDNPYLYFPSKEYCYNALINEYSNLTDDDFSAKLVDGCQSFNDGDELSIPFELFKQKPKIRIDVEYNNDGPYGVLYITYKTEETEEQIYQRLFGEIFNRATKKYISENFI